MARVFPKSLKNRWSNPRGLIQIFTGPRQVGKTTAATSLMDPKTTVYASADLPTPPTAEFIVEQWQNARKLSTVDKTLILDEVQKIPRWSEVVKQMWDEDQRNGRLMRVCLLGSSALLTEKGLSESLTGRFEVSFFPHWTFQECHQTFHATLEEYVMIGGYPKVYELKDDAERLSQYIQNSILEPTLGRDILSLHSVEKPALLRQLFWYVSRLPSQTVSFEKILGHLQDKGNSATLVHYADLLEKAFLLKSLAKFSHKTHRTKRSIPKWILPNAALVEASVRREGLKGFLFENLVGSHLLNITYGQKEWELFYWRENGSEIDFILTKHHEPIAAFEVKSGRAKSLPTKEFLAKHGLHCNFYLIHQKNIENFLHTTSVEEIQTALTEQI